MEKKNIYTAISRDEAIHLITTTGSDLIALMARASRLRDAAYGNIVTTEVSSVR